MSLKGDVKKIIRNATHQGFVHSRNGLNHHRLVCPDGGIVIIGPASRSRHFIPNILADLKRHGYKVNTTATTSLGDAIKEAQQKPVKTNGEPQIVRVRGDINTVITDYFKTHADRLVTADELKDVLSLRLHIPRSSNSVSSALFRLKEQGKIAQYELGQYRWLMPSDLPFNTASVKIVPPVTDSETVFVGRKRRKSSSIANLFDGIEDDIAQLDLFFVAIGKLDIPKLRKIVRRHKTIAAQLAPLRKLLG